MPDALSGVETEAAIARYFRGSRPLFEAFRTGCLSQFSVDMQAIDKSLQQADAATVRRIAHNIKSAMNMLGHTALGAEALDIELAAQQGQLDRAANSWRTLAAAMQSLLSAAAGLDRGSTQ